VPVIYGTGEQRRCFSYIDDCLSCLVDMGFSNAVIGETINIGPDEGDVSILELFDTIADVTGFQGNPKFMPARPQEVHTALCSSDKARRLLNYESKTPLRAGLKLMAHWMAATGRKEFKYHLPIEIVSEKTPQTWTEKLF
jgi:UDP-glucose 4-epimerase